MKNMSAICFYRNISAIIISKREKCKTTVKLPKYLVEDAHEAIIDRDTFQKVQELIAQRQSKFSHTGSKTAIHYRE